MGNPSYIHHASSFARRPILRAAALAGAATLLIAGDAPEWRVVRHVDPITDAAMLSAYVEENANVLSILCVGGIPQVSVMHADYLGNTRGFQMREAIFRFDDAAPTAWRFHYQSERVAVTTANSIVRTIINRIRGSRSVVARLVDYEGVYHDARFEMPSESAALDEVLAPCIEKLD